MLLEQPLWTFDLSSRKSSSTGFFVAFLAAAGIASVVAVGLVVRSRDAAAGGPSNCSWFLPTVPAEEPTLRRAGVRCLRIGGAGGASGRGGQVLGQGGDRLADRVPGQDRRSAPRLVALATCGEVGIDRAIFRPSALDLVAGQPHLVVGQLRIRLRRATES